MELQLFKKFVAKAADSTGCFFTLDGEPIRPDDLADEHALLPLVVAVMHGLQAEMDEATTSIMSILKPADPSEYLLGWRVSRLPDVPEGALLLTANHAILDRLVRPPLHKLAIFSPPVAQPPRSELRAHLIATGLATAAADFTMESPSPA